VQRVAAPASIWARARVECRRAQPAESLVLRRCGRAGMPGRRYSL
ncbi:Molybdopterin-guanine dinucleotide biosynthesis protein MobA, partial [Pseudomonas sp. FEN]